SGELLEKIERAQRERIARASLNSASAADEEDSGSRNEAPSSTESTLSSAVGSTLAQLLKRPEIVIEDLSGVVRERYPEYFAEIARIPGLKSVGVEQAFRPAVEPEAPMALATEVPSGAEARALPASERRAKALLHPVPAHTLEPDALEGSQDPGFSPRLSSAARNEMKTVETEIKYSGYLDQQRKSIKRLKKAEQRAI